MSAFFAVAILFLFILKRKIFTQDICQFGRQMSLKDFSYCLFL